MSAPSPTMNKGGNYPNDYLNENDKQAPQKPSFKNEQGGTQVRDEHKNQNRQPSTGHPPGPPFLAFFRGSPPSRPNHNQKVPPKPSESQPESSPRAVRITARKFRPEPSKSQPESSPRITARKFPPSRPNHKQKDRSPRAVRIITRKFPPSRPNHNPPSRPNHSQKVPPEPSESQPESSPTAPIRPNHNQKVPPEPSESQPESSPSRPNHDQSSPESSPRAVRITTRKLPPITATKFPPKRPNHNQKGITTKSLGPSLGHVDIYLSWHTPSRIGQQARQGTVSSAIWETACVCPSDCLFQEKLCPSDCFFRAGPNGP